MAERIFNDQELIRYLHQQEIAFHQDKDGFIDLLPVKDKNGRDVFPAIYVPDDCEHLRLSKLRTAGSIRAIGVRTFQARTLQHVRGYLDARSAEIIAVNVLQKIDDDFQAEGATIIKADQLQSVGGCMDAPSAEILRINALAEFAALYVHPSFAGTETNELFFSPLIGDDDDILIYSKKDAQIKTGYHAWMILETAQDMVKNTSGHNDTAEKFFAQCRELATTYSISGTHNAPARSVA